MQITIFRGSREVGGSCIEIQSGCTRIVLDVGMPLFDEKGEPYDGFELGRMTTEQLDAKGITPKVLGLFSGAPQPDAILLSHAHLDHVGLLKHTIDTIPVYASTGTSKMMLVGEVFANQAEIPRNRFRKLQSGVPKKIGDFTITPFAVDHSIHGCLAFLIEADGKRLLYTGDFRMHGNRPADHQLILSRIAESKLDALIVEGTHFGFDNGSETSEPELQSQIASHARVSQGLLLASFSPQHFDRLRAFIHAAKETGRTFVADVYTAFALQMAGRDAGIRDPLKGRGGRVYYPQSEQKKIQRRGSNKIYDRFRDIEIQLDEIMKAPEKHLMVFRPSMLGDFPNGFPQNTLCVYSTWQGYIERSDWQRVQQALATTNGRIVHAHTSGHALSSDIVAFTRAVNAKTVIPIHTFKPEKFCDYFSNVTLATDGQPIKL